MEQENAKLNHAKFVRKNSREKFKKLKPHYDELKSMKSIDFAALQTDCVLNANQEVSHLVSGLKENYNQLMDLLWTRLDELKTKNKEATEVIRFERSNREYNEELEAADFGKRGIYTNDLPNRQLR